MTKVLEKFSDAGKFKVEPEIARAREDLTHRLSEGVDYSATPDEIAEIARNHPLYTLQAIMKLFGQIDSIAIELGELGFQLTDDDIQAYLNHIANSPKSNEPDSSSPTTMDSISQQLVPPRTLINQYPEINYRNLTDLIKSGFLKENEDFLIRGGGPQRTWRLLTPSGIEKIFSHFGIVNDSKNTPTDDSPEVTESTTEFERTFKLKPTGNGNFQALSFFRCSRAGNPCNLERIEQECLQQLPDAKPHTLEDLAKRHHIIPSTYNPNQETITNPELNPHLPLPNHPMNNWITAQIAHSAEKNLHSIPFEDKDANSAKKENYDLLSGLLNQPLTPIKEQAIKSFLSSPTPDMNGYKLLVALAYEVRSDRVASTYLWEIVLEYYNHLK